MPARLGFPFIYRYITQRLNDDGRLEFDVILGDPTAEARVDAKRRDAATLSGFEVG